MTTSEQEDDSSGEFDEESCRFFLREVGARVVPYYPFSFGMEEVYSLILEKYGYSGLPDATSVLQELLEDDDSANGFGDDGDIWRSWRHSWRHRNDDSLNPFIPKIGNFVLRPPTLPDLRSLKHARFLENGDRTLAKQYSSRDLFLNTNQQYTVPCKGTTYSHQRCRSRFASDASKMLCLDEGDDKESTSDKDSQQDFVEVTSSVLSRALDPSLFLDFEMMQSSSPLQEANLTLRGGDREIRTLKQINVPCNPPIRPSSGMDETLTAVKCEHTTAYDRTINQDDGLTERDCENSTHPRISADEKVTALPISQSHLLNLTERENTQLSLPQACIGRRDTINRHARLIDGTIFNPKIRREKGSEAPKISEEANTIDHKKTKGRRSWTPYWQNPEIRSSWFSGVRSLFVDETCKQPTPPNRSSSRNLGTPNSVHRAALPSNMVTNYSTLKSSKQQACQKSASTPSYHFLDGAFDMDSPTSTSPMNLNKALPLSPSEHGLFTSRHTGTASRGEAVFELPSTASTITSETFKTSSKKEFESLIRNLIELDFLTHSALPPVREVVKAVQRGDVNCSPLKSSLSNTYGNIAQQNPFIPTALPVTPRKQRFAPRETAGVDNSKKPKRLPLSQSAPNVQAVPERKTETNGDLNLIPLTNLSPQIVDKARQIAISHVGNVEESSDSPVKQTSDVKGLVEAAAVMRQPASPIKRLFGFGSRKGLKGSSPDKADGLVHDTEVSGRNWQLKNFAHKVRHGFLTPDLEQQISEAKTNTSMTLPVQQIIPVSLDPPTQSRLQGDIELMLCVTANRFLLCEVEAGRLSRSVADDFKRTWESRNQSQIIEYLFDLASQCELVIDNLTVVQIHGQCGHDATLRDSVVHAWLSLAKDLATRSLCRPDAIIRRYLHDAHRVLDMLGAPLVTTLAFQELQLRTLAKINEGHRAQFERKKSDAASRRNVSDPSSGMRIFTGNSQPNLALRMGKQVMASSPSSKISPIKIRKATGAEEAIEGGSRSMNRRHMKFPEGAYTDGGNI